MNRASEFFLKFSEGRLEDGHGIHVHRAAQNPSDGLRPIYVQKPLFALEKNPSPYQNCPDVIWTDCRTVIENDEILVSFKVAFLTEETKSLSKESVLSQQAERSWLRQNDFLDVEIDVVAWPINRLVATITKNSTGRDLATGTTRGIPDGSTRTSTALDFRIPKNEIDAFIEDIRNDDVNIHYSYEYRNVTVDTAMRSIEISTAIQDSISDYIDIEQLTSAQIVNQDIKRSHVAELTSLMRSATTATNDDVARLLPNFGKGYSESLFVDRVVSFEDLNNRDPNLSRAIASHLEALITKYKRENEVSSETTQTNTSERTETDTDDLTKKFKVKGSYGEFVEGSVDITDRDTTEITQKQKDELEKRYKVKLKYSEETQIYTPVAITVSTFSDSYQNTIAGRVDRAQLISAGRSGLIQEPGRPASFTTDSIEATVQRVLSNAPFVPVGAALCSFASNPPPGFVWADGSSAPSNLIPNSQDFPVHLRGKPTPKMNSKNILVAGTDSLSAVGTSEGPGALKMPQVKIDPATIDLSLTSGSSGGWKYSDATIHKSDGRESNRGTSCVGHAPMTSSKSGRMRGVAAKCDSISLEVNQVSAPTTNYVSGVTLSGDRTLFENVSVVVGSEAIAPHVKCRWMIRIH